MRRFVILLALFLTSASAQAQPSWAVFPPDEAGLTVVDRAYQPVYTEEGESHFYAVLYNGKGQTYLDIYRGLPWKKLHRWPVTFEDQKVKVRDRAALEITHDEEAGRLHFYWNDYAGYAEAAVHLALLYDLKKKTFETTWSD